MKVGIIRCSQTEDICPGTTDFKFAKEKKGVFGEIPDPEIAGFVSCGGCPGKKAVSRAQTMVDRGAEAIIIASCIKKGAPLGFPCPHADMMIAAIRKKLGDSVQVYEFTH